MVLMRVLLALDDLGRWAPGHEGTMDSEALALAYAYPEPTGSQTWVRANFISSLDGAATGGDGRSGSINTGSDRDVFALLRALSDVILVGAGTARIEGYRRATVRAPWQGQRTGRPTHPTMAVVSRSADIPPQLSQARENSGEVLLLTCTRAGDEAIDLALGTQGAPTEVVESTAGLHLTHGRRALAVRRIRRTLSAGAATHRGTPSASPSPARAGGTP